MISLLIREVKKLFLWCHDLFIHSRFKMCSTPSSRFGKRTSMAKAPGWFKLGFVPLAKLTSRLWLCSFLTSLPNIQIQNMDLSTFLSRVSDFPPVGLKWV